MGEENTDGSYTGWTGEALVMLDAPWKAFTFRRERPKP